jgi:hypothetical protein
VFCTAFHVCFSQKTIDVGQDNGVPQNAFYTVGGEPFLNVKFVRLISGTPYFREDWMSGTGVSASGVVYKAGTLKLDLFDNEVHFLDAAGNEMITTSPLKEVILKDSLTGRQFHFIHSSLFPTTGIRQGWYLQLVAGKASLYQYFFKILSERTPYGSATTEQSIITKEEFYVYHNELMHPVKKLKDFLTIFPDKKNELGEFIK